YFEPAARAEDAAVANAIGGARRSLRRDGPIGGVKVRCGGLDAAAVPSPADVAAAIAACRSAGVPLKFTAALHHPVRHPDAAIGAMTHGFFNVFVAGVLASAGGLDAAEVRQVVEDEDAASF